VQKKKKVPPNAVFTDTVYSPSDVTDGSLEISHVAQLTAVLQSMQSPQDSDTADTILRNSITTLEGRVDSMPTSQILVNGTWLDQIRCAISNGIPQLNVVIGLW
jgi:hypothetical protein